MWNNILGTIVAIHDDIITSHPTMMISKFIEFVKYTPKPTQTAIRMMVGQANEVPYLIDVIVWAMNNIKKKCCRSFPLTKRFCLCQQQSKLLNFWFFSSYLYFVVVSKNYSRVSNLMACFCLINVADCLYFPIFVFFSCSIKRLSLLCYHFHMPFARQFSEPYLILLSTTILFPQNSLKRKFIRYFSFLPGFK